MAASQRKATRAVLIYDGMCPVCRRTIGWIKDNQRKDAFEFLTCQSDEIVRRYPVIEKATCMQAMQLILPDGTVLSGEKALPEILKRTKRYSPAAEFFKIPGTESVSRAFYRWFADNRYHIADLLFPGDRKDRKKQ